MNIFVPMGYAQTSLIKEDWTAVVQIKGHLLGARPLPHNRRDGKHPSQRRMAHTTSVITHMAKRRLHYSSIYSSSIHYCLQNLIQDVNRLRNSAFCPAELVA